MSGITRIFYLTDMYTQIRYVGWFYCIFLLVSAYTVATYRHKAKDALRFRSGVLLFANNQD
jgi:hypothetical protein